MNPFFEQNQPPTKAIVGGVVVVVVVAWLTWLGVHTPSPPATAVAAPWAAAPSAAPSAPTEPTEDTCGLTSNTNTLDEVARARQTTQTFEALVAHMASSPDELTRVSALILRSSVGQPLLDSVVECEGTHCPDKPERFESKTAARVRLASQSGPRDALARMALISRSGPVYGLAWQLCRTHGIQDTSSACQMLSARQWARLDSDNAAAWLAVAEQAQELNDAPGQTDAMFQLSQARLFTPHWGRVIQALLDQVPEHLNAVQALELVPALQRLERSALRETHQIPIKHCAAERQKNTNQQQECLAITNLLVQQGRSLLDWQSALMLAKQGAWPPEQTSALSQAYQDMANALAEPPLPEHRDCAAVARQLQFARGLAQHGELSMVGR